MRYYHKKLKFDFLGRTSINSKSQITHDEPEKDEETYAKLLEISKSEKVSTNGNQNQGTKSVLSSNAFKPPKNTSCEEWLAKEDEIQYDRDFSVDPVRIGGANFDLACPISYEFNGGKADASYGGGQGYKITSSMESATNYGHLSLEKAHEGGIDILMTTDLASDVTVGYYSYAEYDLFKPPIEKNPDHIASAFISNCGAQSFRLTALDKMQELGIKIDSFGRCNNNKLATGSKLETLSTYYFYLAFENSIERDYVTEKYLHALVSGCIPVVIGAPNILDYAPQDDYVLHIPSMDSIPAVVQEMKYLLSNKTAYEERLKWKVQGPSKKFLALVDISVYHSSCRLCLHVADKIWMEERKRQNKNRPCKCKADSQGSDEFTYHLYVRERHTFTFESIFINKVSYDNLRNSILTKFKEKGHTPVWSNERKDFFNSSKTLLIYKIYPSFINQREALYGDSDINSDQSLKKLLESHPCPYLDVIFI